MIINDDEASAWSDGYENGHANFMDVLEQTESAWIDPYVARSFALWCLGRNIMLGAFGVMAEQRGWRRSVGL